MVEQIAGKRSNGYALPNPPHHSLFCVWREGQASNHAAVRDLYRWPSPQACQGNSGLDLQQRRTFCHILRFLPAWKGSHCLQCIHQCGRCILGTAVCQVGAMFFGITQHTFLFSQTNSQSVGFVQKNKNVISMTHGVFSPCVSEPLLVFTALDHHVSHSIPGKGKQWWRAQSRPVTMQCDLVAFDCLGAAEALLLETGWPTHF